MDTSRQRSVTFLWSDAWILEAISRSSKSGPASLANIIAAADAIQHALPTDDELHGALVRLSSAGFIRDEDQRFSLAPEVPASADYKAFLNSEAWTSETNVRDPRNEVRYPGLTDERLRKANEEYVRSVRIPR